jgi:putative DNA primase/helicase
MKEIEVSPQLAFARDIQKRNVPFKTKDGSGYRWVGTHWQCIQISEFEREAMTFIAANFPERANERVAASAAATAIMMAEALPNATDSLIPTTSGYVLVDAGRLTLVKADPKYGLTYVLNCMFDQCALCSMFDSFLEEALPDKDVRSFLQEYAGYTLLGDTRYQIAAWLIGDGGTGKGSVAQIMQALHRHTVALSLDALDGFKLAGLQSASLVCVDETPTRIDEQRLKTLISGDLIQIDRKYRDPLSLRPTAKWIVNGNALPAISDHSTGFWRRFVIFPFNVKPSQVKPLLAETIIAHELPGILNWCLEGLQRLLSRGSFPSLPQPMIAAQQIGKQQSNTVAEWVDDDGVEFGIEAKNTRKDVFDCYSQWCRDSNVKALGTQKFWERMRVIFPEVSEDRLANRQIVCGKRRAIVPIYLPPLR